MEWISVKDRMPDVKEDVLIFNINAGVFMATYWPPKFDVFYSDTGRQTAKDQKNISHWMPLPEPPKI